MKQLLIGWLAGRSIALSNDATDQAVFDAFNAQFKTADAARTELESIKAVKLALENEKGATTTELTAVKATLATTQTALANEKTALANARKEHAADVVDLCIAQGRLPVADRDAKITALANSADFGTEANALKAAPVKFKTGAGLADGGRKSDAGNTSTKPAFEQIIALANSDPKYKGIADAAEAIAAVRRDHPALADLEKAEAPNAAAAA